MAKITNEPCLKSLNAERTLQRDYHVLETGSGTVYEPRACILCHELSHHSSDNKGKQVSSIPVIAQTLLPFESHTYLTI